MEAKREMTKDAKSATASKAANARKQENAGAGDAGDARQSGAGQQQAGAGQQQGATQPSGGKQQSGGGGGEQSLAQQAKQATGEIVNQVQKHAGSQVNQQKESAAAELSNVANAVRQVGETLSRQENGTLSHYAAEYSDKAAEKIEQFARYVREQDPKRLLDDVQNFGRRQPALLIGGAFILGLAGARLIKSTVNTATQQSSFNQNRSATKQSASSSANAL